MSLVTIIVPAYNAEKYIRKCLESVVHQSFDDYDVIIVNDGSSDNTEGIIKQYADKYSYITYYNKKNGGISSARNYGMDRLEQSKYVVFLDSDDYLDSEYLSNLVTKAEERQSDVVCSGQYRITEDGQIISHVQYNINNQGQCVLRHLNLHGKMYRIDYLKKHNLRFPEGKVYEENSFNLVAFFLTKRISFLKYEGYYQLVHLGSITTRKIIASDVPFEALEEAVRYVIACKPNDYEIFEYTLMSFLTYFILEANRKHRYYKLSDRKSDKQMLDALCDYTRRILESYCPSYIHNPYLSLIKRSDIGAKQKLAVVVFMRMLHWNCAKWFVKLFYKL